MVDIKPVSKDSPRAGAHLIHPVEQASALASLLFPCVLVEPCSLPRLLLEPGFCSESLLRFGTQSLAVRAIATGYG